VRELWDELSLHDLLDRYPKRPGTRNLRAVLGRRSAGSTYTRSDLEEMFLRFAAEAGLPRPETNVFIEGFEVDCVWREQRLVIEVDGWETHRTRAAFERDREKLRILQAARWRCVPVTFLQLRDDYRVLARDVRRLLATATLAA
jgi:very-short-patch-repair endonuclease